MKKDGKFPKDFPGRSWFLSLLNVRPDCITSIFQITVFLGLHAEDLACALPSPETFLDGHPYVSLHRDITDYVSLHRDITDILRKTGVSEDGKICSDIRETLIGLLLGHWALVTSAFMTDLAPGD